MNINNMMKKNYDNFFKTIEYSGQLTFVKIKL